MRNHHCLSAFATNRDLHKAEVGARRTKRGHVRIDGCATADSCYL